MPKHIHHPAGSFRRHPPGQHTLCAATLPELTPQVEAANRAGCHLTAIYTERRWFITFTPPANFPINLDSLGAGA